MSPPCVVQDPSRQVERKDQTLLGAVMAALKEGSRDSAHPADQAALRRQAARIAAAVEAAFPAIHPDPAA